MKFQILNNEELGFFDNNGNKKAIMKLSGSNFIIDPVDTGTNIIMGQGETVNDLELGIVSTPINMTFLGGGTISSNAGTLYIGDGVNDDKVVLTGVTIGSSVNFSAGLTGSFQGSFTGDGSNITGITATTAPGGNNKTIQFNDNNTATGGNNNFTFDKTTNIVELTGSINVSGSSSADYFFGDGSGLTNIVGAFPFTGSAGVSGSIIVEGPVTASKFSGDGSGLTNVAGVFPFTGSAGISGSLDINGNVTATAFYGNGANITGVTSTFAPTGQDKSLQFNKGGTEISGSDGILFDYNTDSLYVAQAVTASEFTGHGSLNDPFIGDTETTGSVKITGSLNVNGNPIITGSLFIEKNNSTLAIGKGVNDGGYNTSTLIGINARAYGEHSTAIGLNTGARGYAVGIGWYAMQNGGGGFSVGIGSTSHRFNTGGKNVAVGQNTLLHGNGGSNVALGSATMESGGSNTYNTAIGFNTSRNMVGDYNVTLGYQTGYYASGSKNVLIGHQAGYNLTGSNQLIIANNSSSALITGDFDTGAVEFLGNSFKVGTNRPAGPVFEVGDGPVSSYTTDLILRPRANSAYNFHYWGIIRWDPSGTNKGLRLLSGDYTNSVQIGTGLSGSATENIIANFTNSGVRIGDRSTPNADLDVNGTAIVSGSLIAKVTSGGPTDAFQVLNENGSPLFEVRDGFVQFGNLGDSLGIDFSGGNRYLKFFNTSISAQGGTGISATGTINFSPGSGTNNKVGLLGGGSAYGHVSLAQGSATSFSYPNDMATELIFHRNVNHLAYHAAIRGDDNQYQPVPIYIFGGKHTTNGTFKPVVLQHDTSESRGNVGIGLENPTENLHVSGNLKINGYITGSEFKSFIRQKYHTDTSTQHIKMGSAYELFGTPHSSAGYVYHLYPEGWNSGWSFAIGDTTNKHSFGGSSYTSPGTINTANIKMGGNLFNYETSPHTGLKYNNANGWRFVIRGNDNTNKLIIDNNGDTEISGSLEVNGSNVDFTNLPTSNPGVAGRLYQTGSDAIGATAGFQIVLISEG